jgi:hypothetical protein
MAIEFDWPPQFTEVDKRVANMILEYLGKHPDSKDTLEGIAEWWLDKQQIEQSVETVARGLSILCSQGVILEEKCVGDFSYYKLKDKCMCNREDK